MNVREAIEKRRTIRKFQQIPVDKADLHELIDCARLAAYGANLQPLKFVAINEADKVNAIFPLTKWAGYLPDAAPKKDEQPTAFIAVLGDITIKKSGEFEVDAGAAVTNMMLRATELTLGTCWLGSIDRAKISALLKLPENLKLLYLLAVGVPAQESCVCDIKDNDVRYFVDDNSILNVPKRSLEEIIVED